MDTSKSETVQMEPNVTHAINSDAIQATENEELSGLGLKAYDQDDFEEGVMQQVSNAMEEDQKKRLVSMRDKELKRCSNNIRQLQKDFEVSRNKMNNLSRQLKVNPYNKKIQKLYDDVKLKHGNMRNELTELQSKQTRLTATLTGPVDNTILEEALELRPAAIEVESEQDRLIRLGLVMPFDKPSSAQLHGTKAAQTEVAKERELTSFEQYLLDQNAKVPKHAKKSKQKKQAVKKSAKPEEYASPHHVKKEMTDPAEKKNRKQKKLQEEKKKTWMNKDELKPSTSSSSSDATVRRTSSRSTITHRFSEDPDLSDCYISDDDDSYGDDRGSDDDYKPETHGGVGAGSDDDDYYDDCSDEENYVQKSVNARPPPGPSKYFMDTTELNAKRKRKRAATTDDEDDMTDKPRRHVRTLDDGDPKVYLKRLKRLKKHEVRKKYERIQREEAGEEVEEEYKLILDELKVPTQIWDKLYGYQQTCVRWLWELHKQNVGGILGDEMGLGKTIQMIAFLAALQVTEQEDDGSRTSYRGLGPTLLICPATVMHQWVKEFHTWWPQFRVMILHASGTYCASEASLVHSTIKSNGVLITSYTTLVKHQELLLAEDWHYVILDEGHKIRNPDAQATGVVKQIRTCHRIILSGSPIQNNLRELWSLFDFVFPGKLGTLPDFMQHFSVPIQQGGYTNASQIQVQTAFKCATVLRDTINPYLLRRMKADVKQMLKLPTKNEQVLFCRLTREQRDVYTEYLDSKECQMILSKDHMIFPGLITLRKICNHPDLCTGGLGYTGLHGEDPLYGDPVRSGKMIVVQSLLKLWKKQGHRVLLFTQSKQMLDIMESMIQDNHYTYLRMDGGTGVSSRQMLINKFNEDDSLFVFLLTTRVGGLGVNLTGANRVVIFDPDWNPSTDTQARERAWRIGQDRHVTVYRLLTAGTIEEKIYHRQIFKQFLCNKVLKDPKQRRFFKSNDLFELFTLGTDDSQGHTETGAIFAGTGSVITKKDTKSGDGASKKKTNRFDELSTRLKKSKVKVPTEEDEENDEQAELIKQLSAERLRVLREKAKALSKKISADVKARSAETVVKQEPDGSGGNEIRVKTKPQENNEDRAGGENGEGSHGVEGAEVKPEEGGEGTEIEVGGDMQQEGDCHIKIEPTDNSTGENVATSVSVDNETVNAESERKRNVSDVSKHATYSDNKVANTKTDRNKKVAKTERKPMNNSRDVKKEKRRKYKKKRTKEAKVDGEVIPHLLKQSTYDNPQAAELDAEQNDYVLHTLLKKSGVQSALQHDKIMQSSTPDYVIVEAEADKVAKQAAKALKRSRAQCYHPHTGVPSWTGAKKPRFGVKKNPLLHNALTNKESNVKDNVLKVDSDESRDGTSSQAKTGVAARLAATGVASRLVATSAASSSTATPDEDDATIDTPKSLIKKFVIPRELTEQLHDGEPSTSSMQAPSLPPPERRNKVMPVSAKERMTPKKLPSTPAHFDGSSTANVNKSLTSSDLLSAMKSRNHLTTFTDDQVVISSDEEDDDASNAAAAPPPNVPAEHLDLITDIRNFVAFQSEHNGQATTNELLDKFKVGVSTGDAPKFKAMLEQICTFQKVDGVGVWKLKQPYR